MTESPKRPVPDLRIETCGPDDRAEQVRLFNAVFKKTVDEGALRWRYDQSPHGSSVSLLARPRRGTGSAATPARRASSSLTARRDQSAPVGETGDVMTHPDWRKLGIFSKLDGRAMEETNRLGWPCVFGLPNRHSAHIFLKLGWERVGTIRHWTHILRADESARKERFREGRVAAWKTGLAARRGRRARRKLRSGTALSLEVRPVERFTDEAAALAAEVSRRHALMVRRDAAYLNWRYLEGPSGLHRAFALHDADGALRAFVVVQLPRDGQSKGWLVDLVGKDDAASAAAMEAGLDHLERAGASVVQANAVDHSSWQHELERAGFVPPREENHLIVILYTHHPRPSRRARGPRRLGLVPDGRRPRRRDGGLSAGARGRELAAFGSRREFLSGAQPTRARRA